MKRLFKIVCLVGLMLFTCSCHDDEKKPELKPIILKLVGSSFMTVTKPDGTIWSWGNTVSSPGQIGSDNNWSSVSVYFLLSIASKPDGSLWAWGGGFDGELGNGTYKVNWEVGRIGSDNDWLQASAGQNYAMAIKKNGTLWGWGNNQYGQLGLGFTNGPEKGPNVPTQVGKDNDWEQVFAGSGQTYATKKNGTLWAWGSRYLGNGTADDSLVPIQIGNETNWAAVSPGTFHTLAIKIDGTLWGWGAQRGGDLGNNQSGNQLPDILAPIQISKDSDWISISAGWHTSYAVKKNGTLWGWGTPFCGSMATIPNQIGTDSDWTAVSVGEDAIIAIKKDGSFWTWGCNGQGQLGTGDNLSRATPTKINF